MSTNYYLDSPGNEAGHLGKWAAGRFTAKAPAGVNSFEDWAHQLDGHRIFAENGREVTVEEMVQQALEVVPRHQAYRFYDHPSRDDFVDRGVLFVRYEFC